MRRDDIIAKLKEVEPALRAHGAAGLYLFGSHARDDAGPNSDVDVFIDKDMSRKFGFDEFMDIYFLLQKCLGPKVDYGTPTDYTRWHGPRSSGKRSGSFDEPAFAPRLVGRYPGRDCRHP
jgi:hypothetical protein